MASPSVMEPSSDSKSTSTSISSSRSRFRGAAGRSSAAGFLSRRDRCSGRDVVWMGSRRASSSARPTMAGLRPACRDYPLHACALCLQRANRRSSRVRLGVMAYLSTADSADFNELKQRLQLTDGNLSVHLRKLEEAMYGSKKASLPASH